MSKEPIVFKCEDSMWQMLAGETKTWDARRHDISDDRIYRLSWGRSESYPPGEPPNYVPQEAKVRFLNKKTGEVLEFKFLGLEFADFAPGWCFIQLGGLIGRGMI